MAYDFSSLNDKDFEKLAQDVLNAKFKMDLQDFKIGKDAGRDLRYSTPANSNAVVVQAKHYLRSGYKALMRDLEKEELAKVINLMPEKYILVTSVELSATNKDEIVKLFNPYIVSANDVFGAEDINKYLREFTDLERRWYKLWLSSTNVLQTILHNAVGGRSAFVQTKIKKTIQLYVHCKSYDEAFSILEEYKYILITGQPGVGKTTLAYLLSYSLMSQGYQLVYIDTDVKDAEDVFNPDPESKQLFFFDDFLGATYLEINNPKTTESAFVNFMDRIRESDNKYLILTTRTSIFRNALERYEKMRRIKVDIARKEIELGQYSLLDKARILYNHLYHSSLSHLHIQQILNDKQYWEVIQHRNYNPRLIEFITDPRNIPKPQSNDYVKFVIRNLDNPEEVWRHCYLEQLTIEEKILLNCIYSQRHSTTSEDTKLLFEYMLEYEVKNFNHRPTPNPFHNSAKRLLDGILKREVHIYNNLTYLKFINPSIQDFLNNYFLANEEDRWKLIYSSTAIEQFERYKETFFNYIGTSVANIRTETSRFANFLLSISDRIISYQELKRENNRNKYTALRLAALLNSLISMDEDTRSTIEVFLYRTVSTYSVDDINSESRNYYFECIRYRGYDSDLDRFVLNNWNEIILSLFLVSVKEEEYEEIKSLFSEYNMDYYAFLQQDDNEDKISETISEFIDDKTSDWIGDDSSEMYNEEDWDMLKHEIKAKRQKLFSEFGLRDYSYDEGFYFDSEMIKTTTERNLSRRSNNESNKIVNNQQIHSVEDENNIKEIELLFTGTYDPKFVIEMTEARNLPF